MLLKYEPMENERCLDEIELQHFGHQLVALTEFYQQFIPINSEETQQKLNQLLDIGVAIVRRDYHLLINDPKVIIPNGEHLSLRDYQQSLFEQWCDLHFQGTSY
jgi:hypothetical protein